jgi:hypothetical protein
VLDLSRSPRRKLLHVGVSLISGLALLLSFVVPVPASAAQRTLIIDVVNVGWTGKLNNETYVAGQANQFKESAIPYLNSLMSGQVKFEFGKYYSGPVLLDRQLSCDFTAEEFNRVMTQTGISRNGHYVFAFSPYNDCGYNSISELGDLNTTQVTWFTSTANNYGVFFRPMLYGAGLASSGSTQCVKGSNTDDGWAKASCKYLSRGNPHDATGEQEAGFISLWLSKRVAGTINNVFQRWVLGDFVTSNLVESWKLNETVTLTRSENKNGVLGVFIGGDSRYWLEYRKSPLGVSGVAVYRNGRPGSDSNNYVTFLQGTGAGPEAAYNNGLMQKNELFVSEDKNIRVIITDLTPQTATLSISRSKSPLKEDLTGVIDPSTSQLSSRLSLQGSNGRMPVVEINVQGPINMKLNRVQRYPIEPFDYLTTLPNSPVWGTIGTTTAFDVTQKSVVDSSVTGAFTAIATYADGSTANISNLIRDSIQQKVAADRLAVEQRAAADRLAAEQRAAADRLAAEQRAAADRLALEQKAVADRLAAQKTTITCVKGKLIKKVTGSKPKCPAGYKLKK